MRHVFCYGDGDINCKVEVKSIKQDNKNKVKCPNYSTDETSALIVFYQSQF